MDVLDVKKYLRSPSGRFWWDSTIGCLNIRFFTNKFRKFKIPQSNVSSWIDYTTGLVMLST